MYFLFPRQPRLHGSGTGALSPASLQQLWELQNEMSPNRLLVTRSQPVQSTSLPTTDAKWVPEEHYQKLTRKVCQYAQPRKGTGSAAVFAKMGSMSYFPGGLPHRGGPWAPRTEDGHWRMDPVISNGLDV